jgi:moderate conductance mechanosensitive channel
VAHDLWQDDDFHDVVIEEPEVTGVETMTPEAITVRVLIKTAPMRQWAIARELRQRIKARFDHEGIAMPFTQRVLFPPPPYAPAGVAPTDASHTGHAAANATAAPAAKPEPPEEAEGA